MRDIRGQRARIRDRGAHSHGRVAGERSWRLLAASEIEIFAFDKAQVRAAANALDRFGKGVHADAQLNLSDCEAYALANTLGVQCFKEVDGRGKPGHDGFQKLA